VKQSWFLILACAAPLLAGDSTVAPGTQPHDAAHPPAAAATVTPAQSLLNRYCVLCHSEKLHTAGVVLQNLDPGMNGPNAATWEKVLRKFGAGQMPPPGLPRPKPEAAAAFTEWLTASLDAAALARPNPGRPTIHRLNRAEYSNAIRDLLALDVKPGAKLPADDSGYGFDNIGDVLSLSPVLIERYVSVARMVSRAAVGDTAVKPEINEFKPLKERGASGTRVSDDLPFDSTGGLSVDYHFPVDAEYVIKVKIPPLSQDFDSPDRTPKIIELRLPVKAGSHRLGATFLGEHLLSETVADIGPPAAPASATPKTPLTSQLDIRLDGTRIKLYDIEHSGDHPQLSSVTIAGPYNIAGPGDTPSRRAIFICKPASERQEPACAAKIIAHLGEQAYRRPFTEADLKPLMAFYETGRREGSFDLGISMALRAMLVSPDFLFRVEHDPKDAGPGTVHRISDVELASRLSFFLWSSVPDEPLLKLAEQGKLKDRAVLSAQVDRMLADPRSDAFVDNFTGQWLFLRNLAKVTPDPDIFPKFDLGLAESFERETEMFFAAILRENRPVTDLLSANFSYLNQRLAQHYDIPNVYGSEFRRVSLEGTNRGGLLGQGSILTVTSYPNRTSVVQRGKWVLENLLGNGPPPPPPDIPALEAHAKDGRSLTMRQQMEQHRTNPTCAGCHSRMDPIGFALENYNGDGEWRDKDGDNAIDPTGKLPDGTQFEGPDGLKKLLVTDFRGQFLHTFTEKLMTYALGRGMEYYDEPAVRAVIRDASGEKTTSTNPALENPTIPAIIHAIVNNPQFQTRRTPDL
jgi:mono/diheme cytochrome c family protein